jgi:hypothetical protein
MSTLFKFLSLVTLFNANRFVARTDGARVFPAGTTRLPPMSVVAEHAELDETSAALVQCRDLCVDDAFDAVCLLSGTYANACWANCAFEKALLGGATGRANAAVPGACRGDEEKFGTPFTCASACILQYDPVCGENGLTYSNSCFATCSNVRYIPGGCHAGA